MPKIKDEDINSKYFEKYLLTTITPDGTIISIEKGEKDGFHGDAFAKLIKEMEKVLDTKMMLKAKDGMINNLNEFVKSNLIPISTLYIEQSPYSLSSDVQLIKFPKKIEIVQLESMKKLLDTFEQIGCVYFNEQGKDDFEEKKGLEELRKYISSKMKEIERFDER